MKSQRTQPHKASAGYSLVETLVAISILLLAVVGPITVVVKSIQTATFAKEQVTATFLAQEGIEAVVADRNTTILGSLESGTVEEGWGEWKSNSKLNKCFADDGCNIDFRDSSPFNSRVKSCSSMSNCRLYLDTSSNARSVYVTQSGDNEETPYTRVIQLLNIDGDRDIQVKSTVSWKSRLFGTDRSVTVTTILSDAYASF